MKISEVIQKLQEIKDKEGDINVSCWPYDGQDRNYLIRELEVFNATESKDYRGNVIFQAQRVVQIDVGD